MSKLFESTTINGMVLPNRFVRSATFMSMATVDGAVTPKLIETMTTLSRGGVGMIISGYAYVLPEAQMTPTQLGIYKDELVEGLKSMTTEVHKYEGKIIVQLAHTGNFAWAAEQLIGQPPLVVSNFEGLADSPRKEVTSQDIREIVKAFADAARRTKTAGFDGVQIHFAHGYLLSHFLSPAFNKRRDEYGGNITNRSRILLEVYHAIREAVGENYPVLVKMNCRDFIDNGLSLEDSLKVAGMLANAGIDAIELSGGQFPDINATSRIGINSKDKEAYFKEEARAFKNEIDVPLILVGGIRSFEVAEQIVEDGIADYISMSRPFIREPDLINRWKAGDRRKAECKSDNLCLGHGSDGICCPVKENEMQAIK